MAYVVTDNETGESETLSESQAERKFGSGEFTMMVAGMNDRYSAVNDSTDSYEDTSLFDNDDSCDISEAFA